MGELDASIARLRLFLASIEARESQVQALRRQFRDQMERVITYALYRDPSLDQTLTMMADIDQRGQSAEQLAQHLGRLHARVDAELQSLQLTRDVEDAKTELAGLEAKRALLQSQDVDQDAEATAQLPSLEELTAEIRRLQGLINEASDRAIQTLATRQR